MVIKGGLSRLREVIEKKIINAMEDTQKIIHETIQESINEFYGEYTPLYYDRTYKLLNSLVSTEVVKNGNTFSCVVKIDENYLNYTYPSDEFDNGISTGLDVVQRANDPEDPAWHGQIVHVNKDRGFWDDAMLTLSGKQGIILILKDNFKKHGLNVK